MHKEIVPSTWFEMHRSHAQFDDYIGPDKIYPHLLPPSPSSPLPFMPSFCWYPLPVCAFLLIFPFFMTSPSPSPCLLSCRLGALDPAAAPCQPA